MFRTVSKLRGLHGGARLARPRVPVQLSSYYGGLGTSSSDDNSTDRRSTQNYQINAKSVLQQTRSYRQYTGVVGNASLFHAPTRRGLASSAGDGSDSNESSSSVDSTLERLFRENEIIQGDTTAEPWVDAAQSVTSQGLEFVPTWYNPADWCIRAVLQVQELGDLQLGASICATTLIVRILLFPVVASGQKSASRMAHLSPELKYLQKKYENARSATVETKAKMGEEVNALFKKYETNPFKAMTAPIVQLPVMMGMFFGLKKMPDYFPEEMATGGMYWLTDLGAPDPTYILPGICFVTFLATVELGKEQMMASSPDSGATMLMFMRGLSVMMFGVCTTFPGALVVYFTVTNLFTITQILVLKIPAVKKMFGIWDPPKPVPGQEEKQTSLFEVGKKMMDKAQGKIVDDDQKIRHHNEMVETKKRMAEMSKNRRTRRAIKKKKT